MSFPVLVGKTDYPLRSQPELRGPLSLSYTHSGAPSFRLLDGPPYANGLPHLGHVLNKHLKDAVARAAHASSFNVEWRPGWDCHGLPLELAVEKQGFSRHRRSEFTAAARLYATEQAGLQSDVFQQQGWCAQWDKPWHTHDYNMEAGTLRVLASLLDQDRLAVRFTAVPWCPRCGSTLSGAEQEEGAVTTTAWLVPFEMETGVKLLSWTTTPWTLPFHRSLVVNPSATYVLLEKAGEYAWVSEDTSERWMTVLEAQKTGQHCLGADLADAKYLSPWTSGRVASSQKVLSAAGTGVLHAVPGLSELDTDLAADHGWEVLQHLSVHGRLLESPCEGQEGTLAGSEEAQVGVSKAYEDSVWFAQMPYQTEHPHCWRHKVPLLTRASRQLFLTLDQATRDRAAQMVDKVAFTPEVGRARLQNAMKDRPDWCLSRQRTWGVPVALFLDKKTGQPHPLASKWMRRVADGLEKEGVDAWWNTASDVWVGDDACLDDLERMDDVLDVWFDSGCVPQLVGAGDVVVEGTDQHRGWFQSCVWVAAALGTDLPFSRVACHGFVLGPDGLKLSKSTGGDKGGGKNVPAWSSLPTDVVRLWALGGTEGHDKVWSQETLQAAQSACSRFRGVLRFMLANTLPQEALSEDELLSLPVWDRYWCARSAEVSQKVVALCLEAKTGEALSLLVPFAEEFSALALGSWKDRLYCAPEHTDERKALNAVLSSCLTAWHKMLGVMTPRLVAEAEGFMPMQAHPEFYPTLSKDERKQVKRVVGLREAMGPALEELGRAKVGPGRRRVVLPEGFAQWPGQLLADALDVGQVSEEKTGLLEVSLSDTFTLDKVWVGQSPDPVCPRCRRAQSFWVGEVCKPCNERCA